VDKVFEGNKIQGVIVCVGGPTKKVGTTMCTEGTRNVINACKKYGVKNIAVVTSIGCGETMKIAPFFFKVLMKTMMSKIMADKNNQGILFVLCRLFFCLFV
jgi:nucleoside-diphosphate-sugar epimerase